MISKSTLKSQLSGRDGVCENQAPSFLNAKSSVNVPRQADGTMESPNRKLILQRVILVPPQTLHGSVSEDGFRNISIGGAFQDQLLASKPFAVQDNAAKECTTLATMIFQNRYHQTEFLVQLCKAYLNLLLQSYRQDSTKTKAVEEIIHEITRRAFDEKIDFPMLLKRSGYAQDYIRAEFKKITGCTPTQFLDKIRLERAHFLIDVYGNQFTLTEIAEKCGFLDYVYFSKRFKIKFKMTPKEYQQRRKDGWKSPALQN
mgnify:FL=1